MSDTPADRIMAVIGAELQRYRDRSDTSQTYVAETMQVLGFRWSKDTVSRLENGKRRLYADEMIALAAVLGFPAQELLELV